jgi:hypothetical protein
MNTPVSLADDGRIPDPGTDTDTDAEELDEAEALEFLRAMDAYRRRPGRRFPSLLEILQVLRKLDWRKVMPVGVPRLDILGDGLGGGVPDILGDGLGEGLPMELGS